MALRRAGLKENALLGGILLAFLGLGVMAARTRPPWDDEAWFGTPGWNLLTRGYMGTPVLDPATIPWRSVGVTGIDRHTYWVMPLHLLASAGWYSLFGFSLFSLRMMTVGWALLALWCWYRVVLELTERRRAAILAALLIGVDYQYVIAAADGRMDAMAFALAGASLAVYLRLRAIRIDVAVFCAMACAVAALFTHPNGGVLAVLGLATLVLMLDRRSLLPRHLALAAIPTVAGFACWYWYISQAPEIFKAQFASNSAGRLEGLAHPLDALALEIRQRYLFHFGFTSWSRPQARIFVLVLAAYVGALLAMLLIARLRRQRGNLPLTILALTYFLYFTFFEALKAESYLLYSIPLFTIVLALAFEGFWINRLLPRNLIACGLLVLVGLQGTRLVRFYRIDRYHREYLAVTGFLKSNVAPQTPIFGPSDLGWEWGFRPTLTDDFFLGCRTGKQAEVIVVKAERLDPMERYRQTMPDVYTCQSDLLQNRFRLTYQNPSYAVYVRR